MISIRILTFTCFILALCCIVYANLVAQAHHILVDTEEEINAIEIDLLQSENLLLRFQEIAKVKSKCPSADRGGDLGNLVQGELEPSLDQIIFTKPIQQLYKIQTINGWHLLYTISREEASNVHPIKDTGKEFRAFLLDKAPIIASALIILIIIFRYMQAFTTGSGVKARAYHILVNTRNEAESLYQEIQNALNPVDKLRELAVMKSNCPSGQRGGDLGEFTQGQMVPAFDRVVFHEPVGTIHMVETQFGWHILICTSRTDPPGTKSTKAH